MKRRFALLPLMTLILLLPTLKAPFLLCVGVYFCYAWGGVSIIIPFPPSSSSCMEFSIGSSTVTPILFIEISFALLSPPTFSFNPPRV